MKMTNARPQCRPLRRASLLVFLAVFLVAVHGAGIPARAQDLEPRAYSSSPIGTNFLAVGYSRSMGEIVFDPGLQIEDVDADISGLTIGYGRTFSLFGRQALVVGVMPYAWGDISGRVQEQARQIRRSGIGDARVKLSVNLLNGEALSLKEFVKRPPKTIVGTSLTVLVPTGQYDPAKLINIGSNRWAFKPEVGVSHPMGKWDLDAYAGVWFYASNGDFFPGGGRKNQSPVVTAQGHVSYTFRRRLWAALDATWYRGGAPQVNDGVPGSGFNNVRIGGTFSVPLGTRQSLKVLYSDGVVATAGANFRTLAFAYQVSWFDKQATP